MASRSRTHPLRPKPLSRCDIRFTSPHFSPGNENCNGDATAGMHCPLPHLVHRRCTATGAPSRAKAGNARRRQRLVFGLAVICIISSLRFEYSAATRYREILHFHFSSIFKFQFRQCLRHPMYWVARNFRAGLISQCFVSRENFSIKTDAKSSHCIVITIFRKIEIE